MTTLILNTRIAAPIEVCFDAARDIGLHCRCSAHTHERAVAGVTRGLMEPRDTVTFEAVHFGMRQRLSAVITEFDHPHRFVDEMTKGAFRSLRHTHEFWARDGETLMRDTLEWQTPFGAIGWLFDLLILRRYMRRFMERKNSNLKELFENGLQ